MGALLGHLVGHGQHLPAHVGEHHAFRAERLLVGRPRYSLEMAGLVWGGMDKLLQQPVTLAVANPTSPLQYSMEQATLITEMARWRQPVVITNMLLAGSSAPVSLPGLLALQNAEILGGLVLSQECFP